MKPITRWHHNVDATPAYFCPDPDGEWVDYADLAPIIEALEFASAALSASARHLGAQAEADALGEAIKALKGEK